MEIGVGSLDTRYLQEASKPRCTVVFSNGYEEPKLVNPPIFLCSLLKCPNNKGDVRGERRGCQEEKKKKKEKWQKGGGKQVKK